LELRGRLRPDCGSGRGDLQKVVRKRSMWRGPALSEVEGTPPANIASSRNSTLEKSSLMKLNRKGFDLRGLV
jgi:hypothetical protein